MTKQHFRFPGIVNTVHQTGQQLTPDAAGVNVDIVFTDRRPAAPACAEVYSDNQEEYAEIGLEWGGEDGGAIVLEGYDGVFELPREVIIALEYLGFKVADDLKEDYGQQVIDEERAASARIQSDHAQRRAESGHAQ